MTPSQAAQEEPASEVDHPPLTEASLAMVRDCAAWGIDPALAAASLVAVEEQAREEGYKAANYIRDALDETEREAAGKDISQDNPDWDAGFIEGYKQGRADAEAAAATPSLPDEWLLSISIMEAARRIDLEMSVGHSWRELAMLTNAILADQYRATRLDEGSATPDQGKGEPR